MNSGMRSLGRLAAVGLCLLCGSLHAQVNVTTYHNDLSRTGQNTQETILAPANVNYNQFGKLFSVSVDGAVYAQPLYLSSVSIAGRTHNVVYVETEHDSVYAIDADNGTIYAQVSLIPSGGTTVNSLSDLNCADLIPEVGITGTPVIDPVGGTLYVVAASKVNGSFVQYLHALDVTTLGEKFNGPMLIQGSVPGSGYDSSNGTVTFNSLHENQRLALTLTNGHVVIGWSSHCDANPWHGWMMSYNASTLAQEAVFNTSPNGERSGVWMSGGGPAVDAGGNIYFATGNGDWKANTDYGDSIVKLGPPASGTFPVLDYFTPYNQNSLNGNDIDVAAGGLVILPTLPSGQQLLAQQGKQGTIYLLNINNLGKYCVNLSPSCANSDPQIVQEIMNASSGIWGSPAYWNGNLYWTGANDPIRAYSFNANGSGLISRSPTSQSKQIFAFSAPTPSVSSNGTANAILWALDGSGDDSTCDGGASNCLGLFAYDATNLGNLLYTSAQAANNRDSPGAAVKFEVPIVANGKVYVATQSSVSVFGLLTANPTFSPAAGTYGAGQSVTLLDATPGATIYYTTDGTTPTTSSPQYSTPIPMNSTTTLSAMAAANGYHASGVVTGTFTINPAGSPISVNLASADNLDGIAITGTPIPGSGLDGGGHAYAAALLGTSLTWAGSTFTFGGADTVDAVSSTSIALPAGSYTTLKLLATGVNGNQPNQTFVVTYSDGSTSTFTQSLSDWFTPQNYAGETRVLPMAYRITASGAKGNGPFYLYGYSFTLNSAKTVKSLTLPNNHNVVVLAVDLTPSGTAPAPAATPTFSPAPGSYSSAQSVTLSDGTAGAAIYYTLDGSMPTTGSAKYGTPISVSSTTTLSAIAVASGYSNSAVSSGTYIIASSGGTSISVSLASADNLDGIAITGTPIPGSGLDGGGHAYAAALLGTSLGWAGSTFTFGAADTSDAVSSATIALPAGSYSTLKLLATGVNGNEPNQAFVVTYSDGSTSTFTQSLSDWFTPQNYAGETQALPMAYRITASGATNNGPCYLYGYSFALNSAKTVKSLTLPNNHNVVVLAVDLTPSGTAPAPAATPTFSPAPGSYPSAQSVTLSDGTAGAVIYYTLDGSTPTTGSATYGTPISVSSTTTVSAIAVANGYGNSAVARGAYTIGSSGTTPISVALANVDSIDGIADAGLAVPGHGIDGSGNAYAAALLGSSLTWAGATFAFGGADTVDAVSGAIIPLPSGNYTTLSMLATGVNGAQQNQAFVVTYSDGSTTTFTQSLSDWYVPGNYTGETQVLNMSYRITATGALDNRPFNLYGYSLALDSTKTVKSIALPKNSNVVVLAMDLTP